jgi:UDP-GlcNAc:undecaprenyl-phosphate GlcNAc-1-phosphate transferase
VTALAALVALPVAALAIALLLRSPLALRLVSRPTGERWRTDTTPTVGGIGIALGLAAACGLALGLGDIHGSKALLGIVGGAALVFAAGLTDDRFSLPPLAKLAAQIAAAVIVLVSGIHVEIVHNVVIATAIGLLWLVGMTNAFNLLDNMDGLAATLGGIASAFFAVDAASTHPNHMVLALSLGLALACAGFLPFNLRLRGKASVFMGDSGSQLVGFMLAALGLTASWTVAGTTVATLVLPILILAVPILDTTLVATVRLLEGRPVMQGGRDHSSHRLVYTGLSEKRAVVLLALVSIGLGLTSLAYNVLDSGRITLVGVLVTFALLVQFASSLSEVERLPREGARGPAPLRALIVHRRRLLEVMVDAILISASFASAYFLLVHNGGTNYQRYIATLALPTVLAFRYALFIPFGLYRGVWRYAGARDAASVVGAVVISELLAIGFLSATRDWNDFPRTVFLVDALLCIALVGASRFWERALVRALGSLRRREDRRRTLIVGAGRGGRSLLRELRETLGEQVVGFLDDDPALRRRRLQGSPVLGPLADVGRILERSRPDQVLITIPNAPRERLDAVILACESAGVQCRVVRREQLDPAVVLRSTSE